MSIVNNVDEVFKKLDIAKSFNFAKVAPYIVEAEEDFLIPVLSQEQYDDLQAKYNGSPGTPLVSPYDRLLELSQRVAIYYGLFLYAPDSRVTLSNAGSMQNRGQNSTPTAQWEHKAWVQKLRDTADKHVEKLLKFLEENKATFNLWAGSDAFTESKDTFINTADEFSRYQTIDSRTTFVKLMPFMRTVEGQVIKRLICKDQYDELKSEYESDSLTTENEALLDELKPIIATKTVLKATDRLNSEITNQGVRLRNSTDGMSRTTSPTIGQLKDFKKSLKGEYESLVGDLKLFIEDNIADYPLIEASTCYTSKAVPGPTHELNNDAGNKHFIV